MCPVNIRATVKGHRHLVSSPNSQEKLDYAIIYKEPQYLSGLKAQRFVSRLHCLCSEAQQGTLLITATQGSRLTSSHHLTCFQAQYQRGEKSLQGLAWATEDSGMEVTPFTSLN